MYFITCSSSILEGLRAQAPGLRATQVHQVFLSTAAGIDSLSRWGLRPGPWGLSLVSRSSGPVLDINHPDHGAVQPNVHLRTSLATLLLVGLCLGNAAAGQSNAELPPVFMGSVRTIPLPDGDGAWVLQIVSRGGFTGRGTGDMVVMSDGRLTRASGGTESLRPDAFASLTNRIREVTPSHWTAGSRLSRCSDCIATLVVLTVREGDGIVRTYTSFWDSASLARVPTDVRRIHEFATNVSRQ
jgi:hypothetical protein